ncbi:MAG: hypothetical protein U0930_09430 [Pirellulales bacterium]
MPETLSSGLNRNSARPNQVGVSVGTSNKLTIGGPTVADRNVISGNSNYGLRFEFGSTNNTVQVIWLAYRAMAPQVYSIQTEPFSFGNATLKGTGSFTGNVLNQGTIAPGNSPGIITINGNYTQSAGASLDIEIVGTNPNVPDFDQLIVNGSVSLNGVLNVIYLSGFVASSGSSFRIIDNDGTTMAPGTFTGLAEGAQFSVGDTLFTISYQGGTGNDVVLTASYTTYMVTTTSDSGAGSLRQAILDANAHTGSDRIAFNIAGTGVHTITPLSSLPTITDSVIVDGTTESDFAGLPLIELRGDSAGAGVDGLTITSANSTVKGLVINRFAGNGILITGASATGNTISGNYVGLSASGTTRLANSVNGILIQNGAAYNVIGTNGDGVNDSSERNVISGNASGGTANINIIGNGTDHNRVAGNYIGLTADGTATISNPGRGIRVAANASFNIIGTDGSNDAFNASELNVISGMTSAAIFVVVGTGNVVAGNWVGLNAAGTVNLGNTTEGISLSGGTNARVGTNGDGIADSAERNVVVGANTFGVQIADNITNSVVAGNYVGVDPTGAVAMPNSTVGGAGFNAGMLVTTGASNITVGGTLPAQRNVISGNVGSGILITKYSTFAAPHDIKEVIGNFIGTNAASTSAFPNSSDGIRIDSSPGNIVGGGSSGSGNVISGNSGNGIFLTGSTTLGSTIQGNFIGTNAVGLLPIPNQGAGIYSNQAGLTLIGTNGDGTNDAGERNVIAGNLGVGACSTTTSLAIRQLPETTLERTP